VAFAPIHEEPFPIPHCRRIGDLFSSLKIWWFIGARSRQQVGWYVPATGQLQPCRKCGVCLHWRTQWSHFATKSRCLPALRKRRRVAHALELTVVAQGINWACITSFLSRKYTCYSFSSRLSHFGFFFTVGEAEFSHPIWAYFVWGAKFFASFLSPVTVDSRTPPLRWRCERPISKVFRHLGTQCAQFVVVNSFVEVRWLPLT
jgi:hypothetical protein